MAAMDFAVGDYVSIEVTNPEYNSRTWAVVNTEPEEHPGRVLLKDTEGDKVIAVRAASLRRQELAIPRGPLQQDLGEGPQHCQVAKAVDHAFNFEDHDYERLLNQWVPLPGYGGNQVMVRRGVPKNLVFFPHIQRLGLELWFYSTWLNDHIELLDWDIVKVCPQEHLWPFCFYCEKFHLPVQAHRLSQKHQRALNYMRDRRQIQIAQQFFHGLNR